MKLLNIRSDDNIPCYGTWHKSNQLCGLSMFGFIDPLFFGSETQRRSPAAILFPQYHFSQLANPFAAVAQQLVRNSRASVTQTCSSPSVNTIIIWYSLICWSRTRSGNWPCASVADGNFVDVLGGMFLKVGKSIYVKTKMERERHKFTQVSVTTGNDILLLKGQSTTSFLH